ncbi:hypothetical protein B5M42_010540 [Paenibacillus athensensis]|nr:hypothetical protein [Paenibacillus athensensis]MCD1259275.1 hypothetical protein [Paenibacillus athensensis]
MARCTNKNHKAGWFEGFFGELLIEGLLQGLGRLLAAALRLLTHWH